MYHKMEGDDKEPYQVLGLPLIPLLLFSAHLNLFQKVLIPFLALKEFQYLQEVNPRILSEHVLNSIIHRYITKAVKGENARPVAGVEPQVSPKFYFKIPYIGRFSGITQHRVRTLVNRFCKPVDIKLVFSTFKIKNLFNVKDSLPDRLRMRVVYKFSCASCNACYIGETSRHFATRVREHLPSDRSSHVFKHLQSSESCRISCSADCFTVLDSTTTKFQVKLKESMYIKWEKPDLNQQVKHINLTLSL